MTKPQFQFHLSLYFLLSIHTLSGSSFFSLSWLASGERLCVCLCKRVWVCMLRGHIKGRITRTQTDCESGVSPQKARGRRLSALRGLPHLAPQHHAGWTECLKHSAFEVWDDMSRRSPAEVPGSLSFESSSVPNDKPRSSDGREQSESPPGLLPLIIYRVESICTIKATSWQCWPCPLLPVIHKTKQLVFVLEFLCCCHIIIKLARWTLYWNLACFLNIFILTLFLQLILFQSLITHWKKWESAVVTLKSCSNFHWCPTVVRLIQ